VRPFSEASDRVNPLVVLELRRGLRARTFSAAFVLLLAGGAITALIAYASYDGRGGRVGSRSFFALYIGLAAMAFFVLPYGAFRSLSREREENTWPLLVLTGLGPRRILAGKVGSTLLQALLYASALAPFLLFSYLLQGVDLVTVALLIGVSAAFQIFLTVAAAWPMSSLPTSVDPVKLTLRTTGDSMSARLMGPDAPVMTLNTPAGSPARSATAAQASADSGVSPAGLATSVHPAASAGASLRASMALGKFHGVIAAHTPTGWRSTRMR